MTDKNIEAIIFSAIAVFRLHEISKSASRSGRWLIQRPDRNTYSGWCGCFATEIISLWQGRIFVGGDIDDCTFGYFERQRANESISNYHERKIAWMGLRKAPDSYVLEKARIGMTDNGLLTTAFYPELAVEQIQEWKKDLEEGEDRDEREKLLSEAAFHAYHDDRKGMMSFLHDAGYWEEAGNTGMRMSPRVIYAWAALNRLCQLLKGDKK